MATNKSTTKATTKASSTTTGQPGEGGPGNYDD